MRMASNWRWLSIGGLIVSVSLGCGESSSPPDSSAGRAGRSSTETAGSPSDGGDPGDGTGGSRAGSPQAGRAGSSSGAGFAGGSSGIGGGTPTAGQSGTTSGGSAGALPVQWSCGGTTFADGQCDCGCGAPDPDCEHPDRVEEC